MAQRDLLKRYLDAGMAFTAMTKTRAEGIVRELVKAGEIHRDQVQHQVDELIDKSRRNTEHLVALVRKEVSSQLADFSTTITDELKTLERRFTEKLSGPGAGAAAPTPAKKTPAKKAPAKKTPAKKAPAKKTPAKKTPAKKTPAKKAPAKKAPAKKAPPAAPPAPATPHAGTGTSSDLNGGDSSSSPG